MRWWRLRPADGFTFIEIVISTALIMILSLAALPLARVSIRRQRESELHRTLRDLRTAIDKYKDAVDRGQISSLSVDPSSQGYPPDLQTLVDGVQAANTMTDLKYKFLRRIPIDPITGKADWGLRAYGDAPDAKSWGGGNVFDVYSKAEGTALDKTKYRDW
jgi:general secretion pathway protein G